MDKNYNYTRRKLHLPEYGRHIQEMVDSLMKIEDRAERNRQAHAVIAVMGNINPLLRDTADFTHKLWDHLFIISDFQLDVDSPYPSPTREHIEVKPNKMSYNRQRIHYKHYGKYVGQMIQSLAKEQNPELVASAVEGIARCMRSRSFEYNQEHPNNEVIIKDIKMMAEDSIVIDEAAINNIRSDYKNAQSSYNPKGQKNSKGQKSTMQRSGSKGRSNFQGRTFQKNSAPRRNVNR
ncbi:MAG: DUF4290 domain-containing protein [Rikenellaceae bacterium]